MRSKCAENSQDGILATPRAKSATVSREMRSMPEAGTHPEMLVRRALFRSGLRFRVQYSVPNRARRSIDIAFPKAKLAVFVDGCFWHGCSDHRNIPAHNHDWWAEKIRQTRSRDLETTQLLEAAGWEVLRYWEHDDAAVILASVLETLARKRLARGA